MTDAAVRARFQMPFHDLTVPVLVGAEIVANRLFIDGKIAGDPRDAAGGERMLDAAKFLESNIHSTQILVNNKIREVQKSSRNCLPKVGGEPKNKQAKPKKNFIRRPVIFNVNNRAKGWGRPSISFSRTAPLLINSAVPGRLTKFLSQNFTPDKCLLKPVLFC